MIQVLFVDDDPLMLELMQKACTILGYPPQVCSSALQALEIAQSETPRLILVDEHMHDLTGMEMIQRLKSDPRTADIAVILISACQPCEMEEQALLAGASAFMEKPLSLDDLADVFETYLSK
jgi:CheY-like chemotaxis protein